MKLENAQTQKMGGPSVESLPFPMNGTLKMAGRTDVERVFGYIKEVFGQNK